MQNENPKYYALDEAKDIEAIVIHCSDPRWRKIFEEFLESELNLNHYALLAIPGSISSVSVEMAMPKRLKVLKDYLEFMVTHGQRPRLVIINHDGCRMYGKLARFFRQAIEKQQRLDLTLAARMFKKLFPSIADIDVYMGRVTESGSAKKAHFEKIIDL